MKIVERGRGEPVVMVPGIQGRWAYMAPAVEALSQHYRVVTFDLRGEPGCGRFDPAQGFANYVEQLEHVLDRLQLADAIVCGVSFGGLIAAQFAARRPDRTAALILVSTPGPAFRLRPRHELYARVPWVFGPVFLAEVPRRVRRELVTALPASRDRRLFSLRQVSTFLRAPVSVSRMALRARLIGTVDMAAECARIEARTLVISGEPTLDYVVSVDGTVEYAALIRSAEAVRLEQTGHLGYITRPGHFADTVKTFLDGRRHAAA